MRLGWMLVGAVMEQHFPRRRLLLSGIALLGAAMHSSVPHSGVAVGGRLV